MGTSNKDIANIFKDLASIMELHGESVFKTRSYQNAYQTIRKIDTPLETLSKEELMEIPGIGKAISDKIYEYIDTGRLKTYDKYADITPDGIIELLSIRGLGPKKIKELTSTLGIETPGDLLHACYENRLVSVKGFGAKTQADIASKLQYHLDSKGYYTYAHIEPIIEELLEVLAEAAPGIVVNVIGDAGRKNEIVSTIDLVSDTDMDSDIQPIFDIGDKGYTYKDIPVIWTYEEDDKERIKKCVEATASKEFLDNVDLTHAETYSNIYTLIPPESREIPISSDVYETYAQSLITDTDVKGLVHCHTTYSDGMHTVEEMALHAQQLGYEYIVITDHSKAAFYANGLNEKRLRDQGLEIDTLNASLSGITILKGLECDILASGDLDMEPEALASLNLVIASVHTVLNMDKDTATARLIKAIENPLTDMIGHPTGRLLLARTGYEVDHIKLLDACAANNVAIEVNAHPKRLDIDWRWVPYAMEKGVYISINPDAHSKSDMQYTKYGVISARKGGLTTEACLNALGVDDFKKWLISRR